MSNGKISDNLSRDLIVLENESNPQNTRTYRVWPQTTLDQVFDQLSPVRKTLREILADLKQEIITGGKDGIIFPVTSVNGREGDIIISALDVGLGRVDNTRDIDKPLSTPQRNAIMDILSIYDFNINLDDLYNHLINYSNPHKVSLEDLDVDSHVTRFIDGRISVHNTSTDSSIHSDIRRMLSTVWSRVDDLDNGLEDRIHNVLNIMDQHTSDSSAHFDLFADKEDIANKAMSFSTVDNDHVKYPTTRAVNEFVIQRLSNFNETLPKLGEWIANLQVINTEHELPSPDILSHQRGYILKNGPGVGIHNALAVCRKDTSGTYFWDISNTGAVSSFDPQFFIETPQGLSINLAAILASNTDVDDIFQEAMGGGDIPEASIWNMFIRSIHILPGTSDGTIRYYINENPTTMSDEIKIPGLKKLAYLEWVTENEILKNSIHNVHLLSRSVDDRVLKNRSVTKEKLSEEIFKCSNGKVLGNISNNNDQVTEVDLVQLGDMLRPIIGGWPDPNVPGDYGSFSNMFSPHTWEPRVEQKFADGSRGMRFTGTVSCLPNFQFRRILLVSPTELPLNSKYYRLLETGGAWCTDTTKKSWSALGGSNITGHTFGDVSMDDTNIIFESISIGDRYNAPYDVWIKYLPAENDPWLTDNWYDNPNNYRPLTPLPTPTTTINYVTENIMGLESLATYIINGFEYIIEQSRIQIRPEWYNTIIEIAKKGNDVTTSNSDMQYLPIPPRPWAPTGISKKDSTGGENNGEIYGITSLMEWKRKETDLWMDGALSSASGLNGGTFSVRLKAVSEESFASEVFDITIN